MPWGCVKYVFFCQADGAINSDKGIPIGQVDESPIILLSRLHSLAAIYIR